MGDNRNMGISVKAIAGRVQHGHREIEGRGFGFGVLGPDQAKQAAVTGAQVKDSARYRWSRACSFEVQRLTGLLAVMREKYRETYKLNLNEYG